MVLAKRHAALAAPRRLRRGVFVSKTRIYLIEIPATVAGISFLWSLAITRDKFQHALSNESLLMSRSTFGEFRISFQPKLRFVQT